MSSFKEWKYVYDDTTGWLKFIEAKLTAFLTFETGLFYFVAKLKTDFTLNFCLTISLIGIGVSIFILLLALIPRKSKIGSPLYYLTWSEDSYKLPSDFNEEKAYEKQIRVLSKIARKKMEFLKFSLILYVFSLCIFLLQL